MFQVKRNDNSVYDSFVMKISDEFDLTEAKAVFIMKDRETKIDNEEWILINSEAEILEENVLKYQFVEGDTSQVGKHFAEFRVTFPDSTVKTFPEIGFETIEILPNIDAGRQKAINEPLLLESTKIESFMKSIHDNNEEFKNDTTSTTSQYKADTDLKIQKAVSDVSTEKDEVVRIKSQIEQVSQSFEGVKDDIINQFESNAYYQNIEFEEIFDEQSKTTYYICIIPNSSGAILKHGLASNSATGETARNFANRNNTTVTMNGGIFNVNDMSLSGVNIANGLIVSDRPTDRQRYIFAHDSNNNFKVFPPQTPAQTIINEGFNNATTGFIPVILEGNKVPQETLNDYEQTNNPHPRQVIAQRPNGDIIIFSCNGRLSNDIGMTVHDVARILLTYRVNMAFVLDGGGSTQTVVRGTLINRPLDEEGKVERKVSDFFYFQKPITKKVDMDIVQTNSDVGRLMKEITDLKSYLENWIDTPRGYFRLRGHEGYKTQGIESWEGEKQIQKINLNHTGLSNWDYERERTFFRVSSENGDISSPKGTIGSYMQDTRVVLDANTIDESGRYWIYQSGGLNVPDNLTAWIIEHSQLGSNTAFQVAYAFSPLSTSGVRKRRKVNGNWTPWGDI